MDVLVEMLDFHFCIISISFGVSKSSMKTIIASIYNMYINNKTTKIIRKEYESMIYSTHFKILNLFSNSKTNQTFITTII